MNEQLHHCVGRLHTGSAGLADFYFHNYFCISPGSLPQNTFFLKHSKPQHLLNPKQRLTNSRQSETHSTWCKTNRYMSGASITQNMWIPCDILFIHPNAFCLINSPVHHRCTVLMIRLRWFKGTWCLSTLIPLFSSFCPASSHELLRPGLFT